MVTKEKSKLDEILDDIGCVSEPVREATKAYLEKIEWKDIKDDCIEMIVSTYSDGYADALKAK